MANNNTFKYFIYSLCIIGIELIVTGGGNDDTPSSAKIPIPKRDHPLEFKYCATTNESANVIGKCTSNAAGGTHSPCPRHCLAAYEVKPGDPCDPFLYRFARRAYDDSDKTKDWMGVRKGAKQIIGAPFTKIDADFDYKGMCVFVCPRAMCMGVEVDTPTDGEQYVDFVLWDCISDDILNKYRGVCSCGYLWSLVDPHNTGRTLDRETYLVKYKKTVGLNRRLAWDDEHKRCAAQRYGHCSLQWEGIDESLKTYCMSPTKFQCVNRSANFLGVAYRPFKTEMGNLWYGICDSQVLIEDPFGSGIIIKQNNWTISLLFLTCNFSHAILQYAVSK